MNFSVRDEHCFWYGKPLDDTGEGASNQSDANNGINQMWPDNLHGSAEKRVLENGDGNGEEAEEEE